MRPAMIVHANDSCIRKSVRRFDDIVGVHRHVEASARLSRAREGDDQLWAITFGDFRRPGVPNSVAGYIDRVAWLSPADEEPDDVAAHGLYSSRPVSRRCSGHQQLSPARTLYGRRLERLQTLAIRPKARRAGAGGERRPRVPKERPSAVV